MLTQDSEQVTYILNKDFASVFTTENFDSVPESLAPPVDITPLEIDSILEQDVQKYIIPDVIAITKTWIKPYYLKSTDKIRAHKNEGVICYIKSSLTAVKK